MEYNFNYDLSALNIPAFTSSSDPLVDFGGQCATGAVISIEGSLVHIEKVEEHEC